MAPQVQASTPAESRRLRPVQWVLRRVARVAILASLLLSLAGMPMIGRGPTEAIAAPGVVGGAAVERVATDGRRADSSLIEQLRRSRAGGSVASGGGPSVSVRLEESQLVQRARPRALAHTAAAPTARAASTKAVKKGVKVVKGAVNGDGISVFGPKVEHVINAIGDVLKDLRNHVSATERDTMVLLATAALVTPIMGYLKLSPVTILELLPHEPPTIKRPQKQIL